MFRGLLIIILGGALAWLILRLTNTMRQIMPGESQKKPPPIEGRNITDAEFEDLDQEEE